MIYCPENVGSSNPTKTRSNTASLRPRSGERLGSNATPRAIRLARRVSTSKSQRNLNQGSYLAEAVVADGVDTEEEMVVCLHWRRLGLIG